MQRITEIVELIFIGCIVWTCPIKGGLIAIQRDKAPLLPIAMKALTQIFQPRTPFLTAPALDILFNGVGIDCSSEEFVVRSLCSAMEIEKAIKVVNDTYLTFSVLGGVSCILKLHYDNHIK